MQDDGNAHLSGEWYLVLAPYAGQVDTHTRHNGRRISVTKGQFLIDGYTHATIVERYL